MNSEKRTGYFALMKQAALILALATFVWRIAGSGGLIDALFRSGIVYVVVSIVGVVAGSLLIRLTEAPPVVIEMPPRPAIASEEVDR